MRFSESCILATALCLGLSAPCVALRPEAGHPATPGDYGIIFQEVSFTSSDGLRLAGWFYPAQDTSGIANRFVGCIPLPDHLKVAPRPYQTIDDRRRPAVVICCGDSGNMSYLIFYAHELCTSGVNVLTFDWRGFGGSDPWPTENDQLAYTEYLRDYDAAIAYACSRPEVTMDKIGLFGFSTGGYLSFAAAAAHPEVKAVAARGILTTFEDVMPGLRQRSPDRALHPPSDYPLDLLPVTVAPRLRIPVLLIVGEQDVVTPPWMARRVFERLNGPKDLWVVDGATHGGGSGPEFVARSEFFARLRAFFLQSLGS